MKRLFLILLLATSVVLYNACGPFEFPGYDEGGDGDNTEESTPTPNPEPEPEPEPKPDDKLVTATLTYDECKSLLTKSYGSPKSYTNSFGTWTICVYDNSNGMQINSGKVAYIGTPTFEGDIKKITLAFAEEFKGDILLCSESGTTAVVGQFESFKCGDRAQEYTLTTTGHKRLYIRSSACARITKITIVAGGGTGGSDGGDDGGNNGGDDGGDNGGDDGGDGGETPDPTPDPDPTPNPSTSALDWAELPVIVDANNDKRLDVLTSAYYAHHLCAGGEMNAQRNGTARNYTVCYSADHHCPLWVAAPMHSCHHGSSGRNDSYKQDPSIPSSIQYSKTSTGGGCNKGHMLSSHDRTSSVATNKQVFYYTNIAPQYSSTFNTGGGAWNNFEDHLETLICSDTLYIVLGCYFDSFSRNGASASPSKISFGGRSDVSCPTMFYCAMLRTKRGNTGKRVQDCSASELQCAAFTLCHKMAKGHEPEAADFMSIEDLEKLTGFTYFPNVKNAPKRTYNSGDWL